MSLDINAIKARAAAATPGPWSWRRYSDDDPCLQGARTRVVMSVIRREREPDDPETKSYEDYVRDWETPYVDPDGNAVYRRLTDDEVAEHVKKDWLQDPWGGPQYDNRLAFRDHGTNIMEYARDIAGLKHPDAEFIEHARGDVDALLAEIERLRAEIERVEPVLDAAQAWREAAVGFVEEAAALKDQRLESIRPIAQAHALAVGGTLDALAAAVDEYDRCPICGPGGCAGHTRKPSEVEQPHEFTPYPDNDDRCRVCFGSKDWHWVLERAGHTKAGD